MVRYCNPLVYLDAKEPKLAQAIRDLCLEHKFRTTYHGLTFVVPDKKAYDEILKLADADDSNEERASELVCSHLIGTIMDADKWNSGAYNANRKTIKVKSVTKSQVVLANGTTLKPAKDGINRKGEVIVYVADGEMPNDGDDVEFTRKRGVKTGADEDGVVTGGAGPRNSGMRESAFNSLCNMHDQYLRSTRRQTTIPPMYAYMASLLNWMKDSQPSKFQAVQPILSRDPFITATILLQPFKRGSYILSDEEIEAWGMCSTNYDSLGADWRALFEGQSYASNLSAIVQAVDATRMKVLDAGSVSKITDELVQVYRNLHSTCKINGVQVYPAETAALFSSPDDLMRCDEIRYVLHRNMVQIQNSAVYDPSAFESLLNHIYTQYSSRLSEASLLFSSHGLARKVNKSDAFNTFVINFINSTDFCYISMPSSLNLSSYLPVGRLDGAPGDSVHDSDVTKKAASANVPNVQPVMSTGMTAASQAAARSDARRAATGQ